jgi:hypothetical protein
VPDIRHGCARAERGCLWGIGAVLAHVIASSGARNVVTATIPEGSLDNGFHLDYSY